MPLARVSLLKGKPPEYRRAILDGLYHAMREAFDVPEDDRFMTIDEYDKSNFLYGKTYLGIARDDDLPIKRRLFSHASRRCWQRIPASGRRIFGDYPLDTCVKGIIPKYFGESIGSPKRKLVVWQRIPQYA
jgi:Tautomerase enzyme